MFIAALFASQLELTIPDGVSNNLQVCRNPFYGVGVGAGCGGNYFFNITYPLNNSSFYLPHVTPNVTMNITGFIGPVCRYQITGYGWNTFPCWSDVSWKEITLPKGDLTLNMTAEDGCGLRWSSVDLHVYYYKGAVTAQPILTYVIPFLFLMLALLMLAEMGLRGGGYIET